MKLNEFLKRNPHIRRFGKKVKIKKEFKNDAASFLNNYIEKAELNGDYKYSIMLLVHSLEKGMCMPDPRPFGFDKVKELLKILDQYERHCEFEYKMGISILTSWKDFFDKHGWQNDVNYYKVRDFLAKHEKVDIKSGSQNYDVKLPFPDTDYFENVILSRHSVRDYQSKLLEMVDIEFAIKCFIETPTACNRQMCRLVYVANLDVKKELDKIIIGLPGFNKNTVNYFVVTYDLAAFAYSGERQQGLFNSGLCTMNFVNGLHAKGIGSCCLQWSNKHSEDERVRKILGLKTSERIGVVIGAGYYLEHNNIPYSVRKNKEDLFRVVL